MVDLGCAVYAFLMLRVKYANHLTQVGILIQEN
jgi:hypothetical protein